MSEVVETDAENMTKQDGEKMTAEELSDYYERQARRYGSAEDGGVR
ncbi:MAG: hypothetical protein IIZ59_01475 [Clostridia bacterium]|nr:hypothetical protein [Clostridia bacterium]